MIGVDLLKLLLERYGIDPNKVIENNENVLVKGNYDEIESVIKYLIGELKISPKNIEKAPSILYFNVSAVRKNVEFLQKQHLYLSFSNVETCLHVLNTDPFQLEETYNYVKDNYGVEFINKITSVLRIDVERIKRIEKLGLDKDATLSAAISRLSIDDIVADVQICRENNVNPKGTVFSKTADEIKDIVKFCRENNIDITDSVFNRTADEIKDIVKVCKENNVDPKGEVFKRTADEIKDIVKVCRENNIDPKGSVFSKTADEIKDIVKVCRENNIDPKGNVFSKTADEIKDIIEVCRENNVDITDSVFRRTSDEIKDIVKVCRENNVDLKDNLSVFFKTADKIKDIIDVCRENNVDPKGNVFFKTADEIKDVIEVCRENNIDPKGVVFKRTTDEIKDIVKICRENNIDPKGNVFKRTADEIKDIIEFCRENNIDPKGNVSVFRRTADEIKDIVKVCRKNNTKITGRVFSRTADKLQSSIDFIKVHYDSSYLTPLIIVKDAKHLSKVFPYLDELGVLETVRQSASILDLPLDDIRERKKFVDSIGEPMVLENGKFNSVFGMSRKRYAERVSNVKKNSDGDSYGGK